MAIISLKRYAVGISGFEGIEYTEGSDFWMDLPDAVDFGARENGVLWSVREAGAFRISANGAFNANRYLAARTSAVYAMIDDKFYVAFDDSANPNCNVILARAREGCKSHEVNGRFLFSKDDVLMRILFRHAEKAGRIVGLPESSLELATGIDGKSEFGQDLRGQAIFGSDLVESYSDMLYRTGHRVGRIRFLSPRFLDEIGVNKDCVEVRPVNLGDHEFGMYHVSACDPFSSKGFACSVLNAREFPPLKTAA